MKGSDVPARTVLIVLTVLLGLTTITVGTNQAKSLFEDVGNEQNNIWMENNLKPIILDMCEESGTQTAQPSGNLTNTFPSLQKISYKRSAFRENRDSNPYTQETVNTREIKLGYGGSSNVVTVENSVASKIDCTKIYFNGTKSDGSKISWSDNIDVDSDILNFRVFETGSDGNITVQVRQD